MVGLNHLGNTQICVLRRTKRRCLRGMTLYRWQPFQPDHWSASCIRGDFTNQVQTICFDDATKDLLKHYPSQSIGNGGLHIDQIKHKLRTERHMKHKEVHKPGVRQAYLPHR